MRSGALVPTLLLALAATPAAQLAGSYRIDPSRPGPRTFPSFGAAAGVLIGSGVSGPVHFTVAPATYPGTFRLNAVRGMSSVNTVTFAAPPGSRAVLDAKGASFGIVGFEIKWFRFVNLQVKNASVHALHLFSSQPFGFNVCYRNEFVNCEFHVPTYTWASAAALLHHGHESRFEDCRFIGGMDVVLLRFTNQCRFLRCELDGRGTARRLLRFSGYQGDHVFRNCFLHDCEGSFGMPVEAGAYVRGTMFWHNTIVANTRMPALRGFTSALWGEASSFRNNIVVNHGLGPAVRYPLNYTFGDFDYNCYWAPQALTGAIDTEQGKYRGSLAGWKSYVRQNPPQVPRGGGASWDENSLELNPGLVSDRAPLDPHLTPTSPLVDAGTRRYVAGYWIPFPPNASVATDAEGDPRGVKVDIGADEVGPAIAAVGAPAPGGRVQLQLGAPGEAGRAYQLGASLSTGPVPIGVRVLPLGIDDVFRLAVGQALPGVFHAYGGRLDGGGAATAEFRIPNLPALRGLVFHHAFVTFDAAAPQGIRSLSRAVPVIVR